MTIVESVMNVAQGSMHSAVDIIAVSVARFSAVSVATKKCLAKLWGLLVSYDFLALFISCTCLKEV
jgi:hypothetical protein